MSMLTVYHKTLEAFYRKKWVRLKHIPNPVIPTEMNQSDF
nr:hypothetical protein B11C_110666 [Bartonella sp. 1-1C]